MLIYVIHGKTGLVIGSVTPWVEIIYLRNGAKKVTTVDYNKIIIDHPQIEYLNAMNLALQWKRLNESFDFIAQFSSIEHSGLGRYGDPLDPVGDIREIRKIHCLLKKDGLLFLGLPIGKVDRVVFNAHRIYGPLRLALLFEGFQVLDVFRGDKKVPFSSTIFEVNESLSIMGKIHFLFVLKKYDGK
ncbi:unnamed protein product [Dracunculus medinensis]|uniref:DUF268 domain-containing protein n=1 Tax=Dracunculus medinensis TaxID=318479 RepID=A0A0N4URS6_DRAME|nr:unnamed protein product [Dracunculus medinensis]